MIDLFLLGCSRVISAAMPGCRGLADSRRFAEKTSASPHFTIPMAWPAVPLPLRGLASIYDYVHFASRSDVFACVYVPRIGVPVCMPYSKYCMCSVVSRLVEARCLACRVRYTFGLPNARLRLCVPALVPSGLGLSSVVLVLSCFVASH